MSERWHPREGQLATHAAGALEDAYGNRARVRCSRDDFAEGWMAALAWLHSRSSFRPGEWERQAPASEED